MCINCVCKTGKESEVGKKERRTEGKRERRIIMVLDIKLNFIVIMFLCFSVILYLCSQYFVPCPVSFPFSASTHIQISKWERVFFITSNGGGQDAHPLQLKNERYMYQSAPFHFIIPCYSTALLHFILAPRPPRPGPPWLPPLPSSPAP